MSDFSYSIDPDGIATITWDVSGRSMNVLSLEAAHDLEGLFDQAHGDPAVRGIILTSGKPDFAAGMDLAVIAHLKEAGGDKPAQSVFDGLMRFHQLERKIELAGMDPKTKTGGKPTVSALPGTCLGIGLELSLACHHRIAAQSATAKIGLPEMKVGLFPGAGGTTRLTRMLGLMAASPYILQGKLENPDGARRAGLIDAVVAPETLLTAAKDWILNATDADLVKPWDRKGYKIPGGAPYTPAGFELFVGASAMVNGQTMGVYPAAKAALSAIYEGALVPFDTAIRIEARWFTNILIEPTSAAMIRSLFLSKQALDKGAVRPADIPDQTVAKMGVVGAGMMGAGIAYVAAKAGIPVVLIDQALEAAENGKAHSEKLLDRAVSRQKISTAERQAILDRIEPGDAFSALNGCDLIVEAVFEDQKIKTEVIGKVQAAAARDCVIATNTSTLPISDLAQAHTDPQNFIGLHFFSPVDRMMLVEIIKGQGTGDRAVAKALDFARQIRKTPIVVHDSRFFYANRCILPYLKEGMRLVAEGVDPALIENAARLLGMPLGPLQLADEISITLGAQIAKATRSALGPAYPDADIDTMLDWLLDQNRAGRKAGAGFYTYDGAGKRIGLWDGLREGYPIAATQPDLTQVQHRLLLVQVLEAVRAFESGVLTDIREGDVAAILGWGFAPWSGGPFSWIDRIGAARVVSICEGLSKSAGSRFDAPNLLCDLAESGQGFYDRFGTQDQTAA